MTTIATLFISVLIYSIFLYGIEKDRFLSAERNSGWFHHFYIGNIAFPFVANDNWYIWLPALLISLICWIDDGYQHYMLRWQCGTYQSPLHKFYVEHIFPTLDEYADNHLWFARMFRQI